jgi:glutathione S-transferase
MQLIGVNRSPFMRRVAITLNVYGIPYEQRELSGFGNRDEVRGSNPLGRIPALVLDNGETLIDSGAIIDHLDEVHGREQALVPATGAERRAVLKMTALLMGVCEKCLHAAYERNHRPPEKVHQPWIDDCRTQVTHALAAVEATLAADQRHVALGRLTHADVAAVLAERLGRLALNIDTATLMPKLLALTSRLEELPAFRATRP